MPKQSYIATRTGWIAGHYVTKGSKVTLTPTAARHEHVEPAPKPKPRRPRRSTK